MQLITVCQRINRLASNQCVRANVALYNGREGKHRDSGFEPLSSTVSVGTILVSSPSERELNALFINIDFIRERITPIASAQNKYSFREERSANGEEQNGEGEQTSRRRTRRERMRNGRVARQWAAGAGEKDRYY